VLDQIEQELGGRFGLSNDELVLKLNDVVLDLHAVARMLHYGHGWGLRRIARELDRSTTTIRRWLSYTANEEDKAACRAYKARNRERLRALDRAYRQRVKVPCPVCARRMEPTSILCADCHLATAEVRRSIAMGCYLEGWKLQEIADVLDTNMNALNTTFSRLRRDGKIGYRYRVGEDGLRLPNAA
jgi:hypothetical protein